MFFGPEIWDPALIIFQMGVMQGAFYIIVGVWLLLFHMILGGPKPTLDHIFSGEHFCAHFSEGWPPIFAFIAVFPIWYVRV